MTENQAKHSNQECTLPDSLPCGFCCTRLENLSVTKGKLEILKGINLEIHCGELTALIGPNGAGKSTMLKALLGEVTYTGRITFVNGDGSASRRPRVGYVPQKIQIDAGSPTSVLDLILAARTNIPVWLAKTWSNSLYAKNVLTKVQVEHVLNRQLGTLSGGELQRVLLALALDPIPQLLLLDEPGAGMDMTGLELFYGLVAGLRRRYDLSIVLVSHDLDVVARYADRIVFLNKTILSSGTPSEVFSDESVTKIFGEGAARHAGMV